MAALADGDAGEQAPQAVPVTQLKLSISQPAEDGAEHRLHHVFGIEFTPQPAIELLPGQADQAAAEAVKDRGSRAVIAAAQLRQQLVERGGRRHSGPSLSRGIRSSQRPHCRGSCDCLQVLSQKKNYASRTKGQGVFWHDCQRFRC